MAEYIEREALLAAYDEAHKGAAGGARKLMVEAPAVDVEPVVRCKDCLFKEPPKQYGDLQCKILDVPMKDDDFCNYGERRTDNGHS